MRIVDNIQTEYNDIKFEKNLLYLSKGEQEKVITVKGNATYKITQVKQILPSNIMFTNLTIHKLIIKFVLSNYTFRIFCSLDEYGEIKNIINQLTLNEIIKKNNKDIEVISLGNQKSIRMSDIDKVGIKQFITNDTMISNLGFWLELKSGKEYNIEYSTIEQADRVLNRIMRNQQDKGKIESEFSVSSLNIIFYSWFAFTFSIAIFIWLSASIAFIRDLTFTVVLIFINLFVMLITFIALSVKISEMKKYEVLLENRTKYSKLKAHTFFKWTMILLSADAILIVFRYLLLLN